MAFVRVAIGVSATSMWAASAWVQNGAKWRDCSRSGGGGYPASVGYVTGTDTNYTAAWAVNPTKNALLDAGKNTTADFEAACSALLSAGQIGEIYVMTNDPNCSDCLRMAIYEASAGIKAGYVLEEDASKWVCALDSDPAPTEMSCPEVALSTGSKWRDCSRSGGGNLASVGYVTGTDTNYVASWAVNPSKSALLDAGKNSTNDLEVACGALLSAGQIGEIYLMGNDPNCADCLRMAIYNETTGDAPGRQLEPGAAKWVCKLGSLVAAELSCSDPTPAPTAEPVSGAAQATLAMLIPAALALSVGLMA